MAGLLTAFFSTVLLGGSLVLAISEGQVATASKISATPTLSATPLPTTLPGEPTYTASVTSLPTSTLTPIPPTVCPAPDGWQEITLNEGDSLDSLAATYQVSANELSDANCLLTSSLPTGASFFVPPLPATTTATPKPSPYPTAPPTIIACLPSYGWVSYLIKPGDTIFSIAQAHGISSTQLQQGNCLTSTTIYAGQSLLVPYVAATRTPTKTSTPTPTRTIVLPSATTISSATATTVPPTATNTVSLPSPTASPTTPPTAIPSPTAAPPTATNTPSTVP